MTSQGSGTQTAVIGTEHTLLDIAIAGTFTIEVDKVNMAAGDVLELRIYNTVLTGGTRRVAYLARFADAQPTDDMIAISVPISNDLSDAGALRFTLTQTRGTGRNYPWKVLAYN